MRTADNFRIRSLHQDVQVMLEPLPLQPLLLHPDAHSQANTRLPLKQKDNIGIVTEAARASGGPIEFAFTANTVKHRPPKKSNHRLLKTLITPKQLSVIII